jgi:hypothetical protein
MKKTKMTKFKWFWAWDDEKEEKWLEELSQNGWHLVGPGFPCFYHFIKGEPRPYAYRLDFRTGSLKSLQEYLQICRDAGWEMLGRMGTWYYFRKECRGTEKPEFYSDKGSKVQKYRRLALFLTILMPIMLNATFGLSRGPNSGFFAGVRIFYIFVLLIFSYAIIRLLLRIRQLKKS